MTRSVSKSRLLCAALFFTLMITAGFTFMCDSSPHSGVLSVAAQASSASANATATNNVKVSPDTISLGSTLQATGKVTDGNKPLANASVALHMGDVILTDTQTNANGEYSFDAPIGVYYFPAAFSSGATVYTVVEPYNASFISTTSAVKTVSVDLAPLYLIIAIITVAILVGLYLYARRMRGKEVWNPLGKWRAKPEKGAIQRKMVEFADEKPQEAIEPALPAESAAPLVDETQQDVPMQPPEPEAPESVAETGVLKQAHEFFEQDSDKKAVNVLYDAAIIDVATTHEVTITSHATHWEKYHAIEAAAPEIQEPCSN